MQLTFAMNKIWECIEMQSIFYNLSYSYFDWNFDTLASLPSENKKNLNNANLERKYCLLCAPWSVNIYFQAFFNYILAIRLFLKILMHLMQPENWKKNVADAISYNEIKKDKFIWDAFVFFSNLTIKSNSLTIIVI